MTTTAATLAHIAQPGRSRNGVVRKSGFGRLKSLVIGIPPMRHQPWFNQKVPHHRLEAGPPKLAMASVSNRNLRHRTIIAAHRDRGFCNLENVVSADPD
jgi:hypothetical protein